MTSRTPSIGRTALLGLLLLALTGLASWALNGGQGGPLHAQGLGPAGTDAQDFVPGELLVGLRLTGDPLASASAQAVDAQLDAFLEPLGSRVLEALDLRGAAEPLAGRRLRVPVGQELAILEELRRWPNVAFVEPNWRVHAAGWEEPTPLAPNDPFYESSQWNMQRINASRAWALSLGGVIRVAVVDSGVDFQHPEFQGRLLNGWNYLAPFTQPQDDSGHGTHVAGLIAAALNNGQGVAGLAPQVLIDPRKILDSQNNGTVTNLAVAIREAADAGDRIINLSLEVRAPSTVLESAVNYAVGRGALLVGSTGNFGQGAVFWPAAYPGVLAVAATDRFDQRTYYSNFGPEVELAAPGGLSEDPILSSWAGGTFCGNVYHPQSTYCTAVGTSMSAAQVSGAAALIWGMQPGLSAAEVRAILLETAQPVNQPPEQVGQGRLDVLAALRRATPSDLTVSPPSLGWLVEEGQASFSATLALANPSSDPVSWRGVLEGSPSWLSLPAADGSGVVSGTVRYEQPAQIQVNVDPASLSPGTWTATLRLTGQRSSGSQIQVDVPVQLTVADSLSREYLPWITHNAAPFTWEEPDSSGRQVHFLTDESSTGLALPFAFPLRGQSYTSLRIYSNGYIVFPAATGDGYGPNRCLDANWPHQAVYAWWADLDPSLGGRVSTFRSASGAFVVEFQGVPTASGVTPGYAVTFQVVLRPDGTIGLNYQDVPGDPDRVTVGVEARDSLFSARLACFTGTTRLGSPPRSGQSLEIQAADLR